MTFPWQKQSTGALARSEQVFLVEIPMLNGDFTPAMRQPSSEFAGEGGKLDFSSNVSQSMNDQVLLFPRYSQGFH